MPSGFCECGCGQRTKIATKTDSARGQVKGQPQRYLSRHNKNRHAGRTRILETDYAVEDRGYETPCWVWQLSRTLAGYGQVCIAQVLRPAHRVAYEQARGPIPDGLQIDHLCRVRACVRPDHLEAVTPLENVRRGLDYRNKERRKANALLAQEATEGAASFG